MEAKSSKSVHKKQLTSERTTPNRKSHKKKKKQPKKSERDGGKTSTSPDVDVALSDTADLSDTDEKIAAKSATPKPVILLNRTKYSEAIATLKQNRRKQQIPSPRLNSQDQKKSSDGIQISSSRFTSSLSAAVSSSKGANKQPVLSKPSSGGNLQQHSSLRWEYQLNDDQAEQDRIRVYKQNRRLRYLASANQNYTEWLATGITGDGDSEVCDAVIGENSAEQSSPRRVPASKRIHNQHNVLNDLPSTTMTNMTFNNRNQDIKLQC